MPGQQLPGLPNLFLVFPWASVCTAAEEVCQNSCLISLQSFPHAASREGCPSLSGQESCAGFSQWHGGTWLFWTQLSSVKSSEDKDL